LTMDAMEQLARNVSGYGGRKNLVWLSGAFPLTVFPDETLQNPFSAQSNYGDDLRRIAALFSANQIAVYPVDARGLVGSLMPDASQRATSMAGMRGGPNAMRTLQRSSTNLSSSHDTMNELASQTGGRAFYNRNDIDHAIALSVDAGSTYYTLAYYPEDKQMNGKFRKIDVSIDRKGLQTHYRRGYFASEGTAKDNKVAQMEFGRALAPDTPIATALPFLVRVTPPDKDHKQVTIDFSVVPSHILFQTQDGLQHAQMNFVTCVYDLKGKQVGKPQSDVLSTQLKPETYAEVMKRGLFPAVFNAASGKVCPEARSSRPAEQSDWNAGHPAGSDRIAIENIGSASYASSGNTSHLTVTAIGVSQWSRSMPACFSSCGLCCARSGRVTCHLLILP